MKNAFVLITLLAAGCATELTNQAQSVRTISAEQKGGCKFLGLLTTTQKLGPDKPGNALRKAYNETAQRGGNSVYIISTSTDWAEGASVTAESYRCS